MNCLSGAIRRAVRLTRDGSWLTRSRLRLYPAIVLVMFVALLCVAVLDQIPAGTVFGGKGKPWSDFVSFWVPAKLAAEGRVAAIYDPVLMQSLQESIRGPLNTFQIWPYPPTYL